MAKTKPPKSIKMLFIGNSFTQRNNLPGLLAELAAARGISVAHELISVGGASLRTHWNAGRAAHSIETGGYDYVVLQEQSTLPVKNATRMAENVRLFDEAIRRAGTETVPYMTWARRHAAETQQAITDAYTTIGDELGAIVVPVGLAWKTFLAKHDQPVLHDRDGSHPTLAGSYLAACVFLAVLLKQNPVGIETGPTGLDKRDMACCNRRLGSSLGMGGGEERLNASRCFVTAMPAHFLFWSWPLAITVIGCRRSTGTQERASHFQPGPHSK